MAEAEKEHTRSRWVLWSALAVIAIYGIFVFLLWRTGVLTFDQQTRDSQAFAAVLGLLGGFFASSLTFVGVVLKHSLDERNAQIAERNARLAEETERRLTLESQRNDQLKREEARRLSLEASIKAVDLLSSPDGEASSLEQAGALFALAHLGEVHLAITLLCEMWPAGSISPRGAVGLIDQGLTSSEPTVQGDAASTLLVNAARLPTPGGGLELPPCVYTNWPKDIPLYARQDIITAMLQALLSKPLDQWRQENLNGLLVILNGIRIQDGSPHVQSQAIWFMRLLFDIPGLDQGSLQIESGDLDLGVLSREIRNQANEVGTDVRSDFADLVAAGGQWAKDQSTTVPNVAD